MTKFAYLALVAVVGVCLALSAPTVKAQRYQQNANNGEVGAAPQCPYGYFDYPPYDCAPQGYYGPEWFKDGTFIGAGPWFHGATDFKGKVDPRFDPQEGYKGPLPRRGDQAEPEHKPGKVDHFKGTETRDGRGHVETKK
jgi:hypothetical protein